MKDSAINRKPEMPTEIMLGRARGVAIAAGCVAGMFLMFLSPLALIFSAPLILGALVQPRSPRSGRSLMWVGALVLSCLTLFYSVLIVRQGLRYFDLGEITIYVVSVATTVLVIWCDVELVLEAIKARRTVRTIQPRTTLVGEGVAWLVAIGLSAWIFPAVPNNLHPPAPDYPRASYLVNLAFSISILLPVIAFDVWLIARTARMWRTRRVEKQ